MITRRPSAICVVVAVGLLVAGCAGNNTGATSNAPDTLSRANKNLVETSDKPKVGGKLVYGLSAETNGWNPATSEWVRAPSS